MIPFPSPTARGPAGVLLQPEREGQAPASARAGDARATVIALVELTKPAVTRMVLATTWCGAAIVPGPIPSVPRLLWALVGTALVVASANALNMYLEGDVDALMTRTRGRPLPTGRLAPEAALLFGLGLAVVGVPILHFLVNPVTAFIGAAALATYVLVYTPMKRVSSAAVWVGAVPGAVPPLMGWTSVTGGVAPGALAVFLLLFVWQIPHFHAIAIFRHAEYRRAGLRVLPVAHGLEYTKFSIVCVLILQLFVSALPAFAGLGGLPYVAVAATAGALYVALGLYGLRPSAGPKWARGLFFASMPYLLLLLGALVLGTA